MKKLIVLFIISFSLLTCGYSQVNLKNRLKRKVEQRVNKNIDEGIDKGLDKTEEGIKDSFKNDDAENKTEEKTSEQQAKSAEKGNLEPENNSKDNDPELTWSKYDFVPGDKVIFEDNLEGEENGEFPSRWDLMRGAVEVANLDGENVIMFREGQPGIVPYLKDPQKDYLPDVFTVELDLYYPGSGTYNIFLYDRKNQKSGSPTGYTDVEVNSDRLTMGESTSRYPDEKLKNARWMHIAIAYTNGKLKAYMDDTRLINIPHLDFDPKGLTLYTYHARNDNRYYVRNVRIAEGGVKYYDRVMKEGKIIVNGIRFDVGKSTLKPESMGAINEIYKLMKEKPDLEFSVEGHTDSQGDEDFNMKLSQERAETVMNTLIKMGVSADRLKAKGWGESKPLTNNASPEDMANNRRVEFVKL